MHIAIDNTAVVAALGKVSIGSTAYSKTSTGGTGNANAVSARAIVGTIDKPVKPAAEIPVTIPRTRLPKAYKELMLLEINLMRML